MQLVLASQSPRRSQLLAESGLSFTTCVPDVDESLLGDEDPAAYVERLARAKAIKGLDLQQTDEPRDDHRGAVIVLAADTTVVVPTPTGGDEILGKPCGLNDSVRMLNLLSGRTHAVHTGVAVTDGSRCESQVVSTLVTFRHLTDTDIERYCATGEGADKAGSYGIQGIGGIFVERIEGSFSSVMGLPMAATETLLQSFNVDTWSMRDQWLKNSS